MQFISIITFSTYYIYGSSINVNIFMSTSHTLSDRGEGGGLWKSKKIPSTFNKKCWCVFFLGGEGSQKEYGLYTYENVDIFWMAPYAFKNKTTVLHWINAHLLVFIPPPLPLLKFH